MESQSYTVSQVARMAHVTVRALHHYDELGLLVPSLRSAKGYRLYTAADMKRLQRIVVLRELGFTLPAVATLLGGDAADLHGALLAQRARLQDELKQRQAVLRAIDVALELTEREGASMAAMFEGVEQFASVAHEDEVRERWGETALYEESSRRTKRYTQQDWARMKAEAALLLDEWTALFTGGSPPHGEQASALAERARLHIDRWFYPCSHAQHAAVSALYVRDERFRAYYDVRATGLADYVAASIVANNEQAQATRQA